MNLVETGKRIMVGTGAQAVLWVLLALSVVSIAVILERAAAYLRRRGDVDALRRALVEALGRGGVERAREALVGSSHPAAVVAMRGLGRNGSAPLPTPKEAEEAMDAEMVAQKGKLESGLGVLATLGANAPFVGLFGTVVGIVGAFDALGHGGGGLAATGGAAAAQGSLQVMASIGEALVATAVGIGVAIPAVAAFNGFSRAAKRMLAGAEILEKEILAYLEARAARASREPSVILDLHADTGTPASSRAETGVSTAQGRKGAYANGL